MCCHEYQARGLVINYGEGGGGRWLHKGRGGGHVKFYPQDKGGGWAEKVLAMLKGGEGAHNVLG